jgi:drug/metabolite transporter (DMT)-like permease
MTPERRGTLTRRGAYIALAVLTLIWGSNWIVMKEALANASPVTFNVQRTWVAVVVLFGALLAQGRSLRPGDWRAAAVAGFFQTTVNFSATAMALASGGVGRTAVLVFTMPFWTLLIARLVLNERVRGLQWVAIAFAFAGLALVVAPWSWEGNLAPKFWAVLSGFGWAAGSVATKYFQKRRGLDTHNFVAWQMLLGVLPLTLLPLAFDFPETRWSVAQAALLFYVGAVSTAFGFLLWIAVLRFLPAGTASLNMFAIPVIALASAAVIYGERLSSEEWIGIAFIGLGLVLVTWVAVRASRRGLGEGALPGAGPLEGG